MLVLFVVVIVDGDHGYRHRYRDCMGVRQAGAMAVPVTRMHDARAQGEYRQHGAEGQFG